MALKHFQVQFQSALMADSPSPQTSHLETRLSPETPPSRFKIYQNNCIMGLIKALAGNYPVCERLVGGEFFCAMAEIFIRENPSTHFSLNDYGTGFSQFIQDFPPLSHLKYLPDVAKLEWMVHQLLLSPLASAPRWDIHTLQDVTPAQASELLLKLSPHLKLIASAYPIDRIFETNQPEYCGEDQINLDSGKVWLLLVHEAWQLKILKIDPLDWQLLKKIEEKETLKDLYRHFSPSGSGVVLKERLLFLIQAGYILGLEAQR